ncbi:CDP-archaeol synthase [Candidatus Woesearchaeota archaeon]|mgnify:CR=1 FL=1|jgi:CDP-2,3-bis-(O-geranylgeranyl)-sn-glycerol synthase|nr:CDP-archaeol synthase [Candidatus Woesearchaeota archaeon]MBT4387158.1 CDP-archaeol synthase [Candidatus Woesearchaeota archaeon]MBT4596085.1 CDP-archaeol synthase [Candidatus Woesearchaeota archaeon]MBT5741693.1 CDP-archaeol synthase [Candidatus Woesearchaeota archaeon]MBT6505450.1 CDP-archaeol synthase [Candidatus Woesearchaeota archaeon]
MNKILIEIFIFILPFAFVNIFASLSRLFKFKFLEYPLDFNIKLNNKRIFGNNKTFRGAFFGIVFGIICMYILFNFKTKLSDYLLFDFNLYSPLFYGIVGGLGVILGDAIESFFKRRLNIKPGKPLHFFDQTDWVIGLLVLTYSFTNLTINHIILILIIIPIFHYLFNYFSYLIGLQKNKF